MEQQSEEYEEQLERKVKCRLHRILADEPVPETATCNLTMNKQKIYKVTIPRPTNSFSLTRAIIRICFLEDDILFLFLRLRCISILLWKNTVTFRLSLGHIDTMYIYNVHTVLAMYMLYVLQNKKVLVL
jgi:hypothetical protein